MLVITVSRHENNERGGGVQTAKRNVVVALIVSQALRMVIRYSMYYSSQAQLSEEELQWNVAF